MRFLTSRDFRIRPGDVWKQLQEEKDLIVTLNGKPVAIMSRIDEDSLEPMLAMLRRTRAAFAMQKLQESALKSAVSEITEEEIDAEIRATRSRRRQ